MTKEDRQEAVLRFLADKRLALPQKVIYRNLRLHHGVTFSYRSVDNYVDEFVEEGLVRRVDPESLEDRELVDVDRELNKPSYYIITELGLEAVGLS